MIPIGKPCILLNPLLYFLCRQLVNPLSHCVQFNALENIDVKIPTHSKTDQNIPQTKASRCFPLMPLLTVMLAVTMTIVGVAALAIITDYKGVIELKLGPDGGQLRIEPWR